MKKFENIFLYSVVGTVIIIHLYAYRIWLFSSGILSQGDWVLSFTNYSKSLLSPPIIWKSYMLGSIDLTPPFYPFLLLQGILSNLGFSYAFIERVTFMWPIALFAIPFCYFFVKSFTKSRIAALAGALVYAYNTYFLIIQSGQLTLMAGFTFAPLVLLFLRKAIEKKNFFYAILTGLVAFIVSFYEFRAFYLVTFIGFFYYLYYLFVISDKKIFQALRQTLFYAISPIIIVILLNIYWILPYMLATVSLSGTVFDRGLFGNEFFDITKTLTLFHPFWTGDKYYPFIIQAIPFYFFLLPFFAFLGLYSNRKNKNIIFFGLLSLLGIFLSKQGNLPFPTVYAWLFAHFPGFGAFREASKFYFFIAIGYSVLIGAFVDWIWNNWNRSYFIPAKYALVILTVGLSVWNMKPLVLGTYGTLFADRTMPSAYMPVNDFIDNQNEFFRTLWVPTGSRWGTNTDLHPKIGESETISSTWKSFSDVTKYPSIGDQFIDFLKHKNSQQLLNDSSIKYLIVPLADTQNDDNFFVYFNKSPNDYVNTFDKIKTFKKVTLPEDQVTVFENMSYKPHIYMSDEKISVDKNIPIKKVQFIQVTNSEYKVQIAHVTKPFYLQFTDSYHPDWRIRLGKFDWYGMLGNNNYFLPKSLDTKNVAQLNSFYIDPQDIIKNQSKDSYTVNNDGSINLDMTLYFSPQTDAYIGVIISVFTVLVLAIYFILSAFKNYEKKT